MNPVDTPAQPQAPSVQLVSLPWTSLTEPSLGLGILKALLDDAAIPSRVWHLNLFLLEHLRSHTYYALANVYALNDFLFSGVLAPEVSRHQMRWLRQKCDEMLSYGLIDARAWGGSDGVVEELLRLRRETLPAWLAHWADQIVATRPTLVGLTCMFDQTIAALALSRLIKERAPQTLVALGGYAVRSPTGPALMRSFPWVDAICVGEGEEVIVALARASCGALPLAEVPGIFCRTDATHIKETHHPLPVDLNKVPIPNYDDFFADLQRLKIDHQIEVEPDRLPIENSRGCWWGQKHHCIFCGIHDDDMSFRARDADKVIQAMDVLSARHGISAFRFSDYILAHRYFTTLLPALAQAGRPYRITSEIKANLNAHRFALLAAAGFEELQPGIESFSTSVHRKMEKGVNTMQCIHTLLMGKRHGIAIRYNILYGFPNESVNEVDGMLALMPRLAHLDPPSSRVPVQITRYAPLQTAPERFGIARSQHEASYELIFSEAYLETVGFDLDDFCYYYERPFENAPVLRTRYAQVDRLVDEWKQLHSEREVDLAFEGVDGRVHLTDSRTLPHHHITLDAAQSDLYLALQEPTSLNDLRQRFMQEMPDGALDQALEWFDTAGLVYRENDLVLALGLPVDPLRAPAHYEKAPYTQDASAGTATFANAAA